MVAGVEMKEAPGPDGNALRQYRYGTINCGLDLMREAWTQLEHVWSIGAPTHRLHPGLIRHAGRRIPAGFFTQNPVDIIAVDSSTRTLADQAARPAEPEPWELLIWSVAPVNKPALIIEVWPGSASYWRSNGPFDKLSRTRWSNAGYRSHCQHLNSTHIGGAIDQPRFIIIRCKRDGGFDWHWETVCPQPPRPMSNLLIPHGLLPPQSHREYARQNLLNFPLPRWDCDPMPCRPGSWIETSKGRRRLLNEEIGRGLGIPKTWNLQYASKGTRADLNHTTSLFHWEYLGRCLTLTQRSRDISVTTQTALTSTKTDAPNSAPFHWAPPDLRRGGAWHQRAIATLRIAAATYPDPNAIYSDGLSCLDRHRTNYDSVGSTPTTLQILWWNFPKLHWDSLRIGSRMNFRRPPPTGVTPNSTMTPDQLTVAGAFVDELIGLGTLIPVTSFRANAPLFCVPKAGQPGEWRVIANMLTGGQNSTVANDPVFLNRPLDILRHMYTGGWSAVADASKFFYQFRVHPDDQPYLGVIHPVTGKNYVYGYLPMGGSNSPALAGRFGLSFLRLLRIRFPEFRGAPRFNSRWATEFVECSETFDPGLGYGLVFTDATGAPTLRTWVHVDDFMLHGPTKAATTRGLELFLDLAVEVGLLCHPKKLVPPSHTVTYVGFEFDTTNTPTIRVPDVKRQRAEAMIGFIRSRPARFAFSRLTLSVLAGVLESISEATPKRLGHTYLRRLHAVIHPEGSGPEIYYTRTTLTPHILRDLAWWSAIVRAPISRQVHSSRTGTLVPTWGDGSGTGTGGTLGLPDGPLRMWMGTWTPYIFRFSSNWKELSTLALTLQHLVDLQQRQHTDVRGCSVFYFTDNEVTYWVAQNSSAKHPHLHALIEQIRLLELELDIELHVIHVPGVVMISQGTDGLSRGIWMSQLHKLYPQYSLTGSVFRPVHPDPWYLYHAAQRFNLAPTWEHFPWFSSWDGSLVLHRRTIWFPPPEATRQLLCFLLSTWVESPLDTGCLVILPRVMSENWKGLSQFLDELCTIYPKDIPLRCQLPLPIPIIVLHLSPHTRCLSRQLHRMEPFATPAHAPQHIREADRLRALSSDNP